MRKKSENLKVRPSNKKMPQMSADEFKHYNGDNFRGCSCQRISWWTHHRECQGTNCQNGGTSCWFESTCIERPDDNKDRRNDSYL